MRTSSWMTWLKVAFSRSASGVEVLTACRKTAVPGTLATGWVWSHSMKGSSGPSSSVRRCEHQQLPSAPAPGGFGVDEEEGRADEERARDGKAVGGGEVLRGTEEQQEGHDPDEERPVDHGHVDLSPLQARGVPDGEARNIAESLGLPRHREGARDDGL